MSAIRLSPVTKVQRQSAATGQPARLHIDWTRCEGRALCIELLPDLLSRDEWGYPEPLGGNARAGVSIPPELFEDARDAVHQCPVQALRMLSF